MPNLLETVINNPEFRANGKQALSRYLIPALVATIGTGGIAAYIAGSKRRVGESPSARRKRIIRSTLLPTLAAALGSAGLIGASTLWNTSPESFTATEKLLENNKPVNYDDVADTVKDMNDPGMLDSLIPTWGTVLSGGGGALAGERVGAYVSNRFNLKNPFEKSSPNVISKLKVPSFIADKSPRTAEKLTNLLTKVKAYAPKSTDKVINGLVRRSPSLAVAGIGGLTGIRLWDNLKQELNID